MSAKGLLLINLGSPVSTSRRDVKRYLDEFLMDPLVIDIPYPLRWLLVHAIITPFRAGKSAHAYEAIWTKNGSPLTHFTREFCVKVKEEVSTTWDVRWGMRYGEPSLSRAVRDWAVDEIYVVPLYPQYAESSSRTAIDRAVEVIRKSRGVDKQIYVLKDFYNSPEFIEAQARQISKHYLTFKPDRLLLSFHGLPEHHMTKLHPQHCLQSNQCCEAIGANNRYCYRAQCLSTASALRTRLGLDPKQVTVSFQSRLGRRPWIKPYTDLVIAELVNEGVKRVLVSCPSFVADCLETLEEVEIRLRLQFIALGGQDLQLVPAVNAEDHWVKSFGSMVSRPDLAWQAVK